MIRFEPTRDHLFRLFTTILFFEPTNQRKRYATSPESMYVVLARLFWRQSSVQLLKKQFKVFRIFIFAFIAEKLVIFWFHSVLIMAEGRSCSFSKYSPISCGNFKNYRFDREYVPLRTSSRDISSHLRRLKTSRENIKNECHLILLRAGVFREEEGDSLTICPQHRDVLGPLWSGTRVDLTISVAIRFIAQTGPSPNEEFPLIYPNK